MNVSLAAACAPCCPVCRGTDCPAVDVFPVRDLCATYKKQLAVDIRHEFPSGLRELTLHRCARCGMEFFNPLRSGSTEFYASLAAREDLYYSPERWEFGEAIRLLSPAAAVLDVGCGDGYFLSQLPQKVKTGIEFNAHAVAKAVGRGLDVKRAAIEEIESQSFDAIVMFHVLEHLTDPVALARQAHRVLRPDGLWIVSVPNNDSFIGKDILQAANAPPHHPLRWREDALEFLPRVVPFRLAKLAREPLGPQHLFLYRRWQFVSFLERRLRRKLPLMRLNPLTILIHKLANLFSLMSLRLAPGVPKGPVDGFSILAVYQKAT